MKHIKKVAVLGSGVMGSQIACHFANVGVEVLLLDKVTDTLSKSENKKSVFRNKLVNNSLQLAIKTNPSPLYDNKKSQLISTGNFEDDLEKIHTVDWIIEAIIENIDIKKLLFEQVEKYRSQGTLITSNTSGIPLHQMLDGRSLDFQKHFCGTHFFNPPRYLRLLEIIPTDKTDPHVSSFLQQYGSRYLGKETVLCHDTPAFIANRVGIFAMMSTMHLAEKMSLTVSDVDKLTGPVIGHPKSATFRTSDLVGLDTTARVAESLIITLKNDEAKSVFQLPNMVLKLLEKKWLGDKTGSGFYKKIKKDGKSEIRELDLNSFEYIPKNKPSFEAIEQVKNKEKLSERLLELIVDEGKAGEFYRQSFYQLFGYCSFRIPEIADELFRIDQAMKAGFAWELGPFETWDALGVAETLSVMKEMDIESAAWVKELIEQGHQSFYKFENGKKYYYDISSKTYKIVPGSESIILLDAFKKNNIVWHKLGATLYELGDDVLGLEFHTKMNTIDADVLEGITTGISLAEKNYKGIVIGNESPNFSAGANLASLYMYAVEQEFEEIDIIIRTFQHTVQNIRVSSIPIVATSAGLTLGGGCEIILHCDAIQAYVESYIGLVEFGVGLIPAGCGTKEMTLRASDAFPLGGIEENTLQKYFMNIATAKVSTSAAEAQMMNYLTEKDAFSINKKHLLTEAKNKVCELYDTGYTQPTIRKDIKVLGKNAMAMFYAGISGMHYGNYISEHDAKIARKLAFVMAGGELSAPSLVNEQYLLDLEREAFLSLCGEPKTLERMQSILFKGRQLRN